MVKIINAVTLAGKFIMELISGGFESLEVWIEAGSFRIMIITLCKQIPTEKNSD